MSGRKDCVITCRVLDSLFQAARYEVDTFWIERDRKRKERQEKSKRRM